MYGTAGEAATPATYRPLGPVIDRPPQQADRYGSSATSEILGENQTRICLQQRLHLYQVSAVSCVVNLGAESRDAPRQHDQHHQHYSGAAGNWGTDELASGFHASESITAGPAEQSGFAPRLRTDPFRE